MSAWRLALRRGVLIRLRSPKDLRGVGADGCALPPDHCTGRHEGAGHHFDERGHAPPFPRCASRPTLLSCGPLAPDLMAPGRREAGAKGGGGGCSGYWSRLGLLLHVRGARSAPVGAIWSSRSLSAPALSERAGRPRLEGGGGEGGRGGGACRRLRRASDLPRAACWRAGRIRAQWRDLLHRSSFALLLSCCLRGCRGGWSGASGARGAGRVLREAGGAGSRGRSRASLLQKEKNSSFYSINSILFD